MLVGPLTAVEISTETQKRIRQQNITVQPTFKTSFNKEKQKQEQNKKIRTIKRSDA